MGKKRTIRKSIRNEAGVITLDFIFALTIAFSFTAIFLAISFSLAMVEVGQYVTYATSRAYHGAHETESQQRDLGIAKFNELKNRGFVKAVLQAGWVSLGDPDLRNFSGDVYEDPDPENQIFSGARIRFHAKVLNIRVPFLGTTANPGTTGVAFLNSFLMREVSTQECRENFNQVRYERFKQLNENYEDLPPGNTALITDNGC